MARSALLCAAMIVVLSAGAYSQQPPRQEDASPAVAAAASKPVAPASAPAAQTAPAEPLTVAKTVAAPEGVTAVKLSNGLTVIVKVARTSPVVDVRAFVRAGGLFEGRYLGCGISHLTEHLVAQGAEHEMGDGTAQEAKHLSDRVQEIGGQSNAFTSDSMTCYFISAASGKTMDCVDLIADWMARPEISQADFKRELGVVQRELEMGNDSPQRQLSHAHEANVYGTHPAAVPVIGFQAPLSRLTLEDVLAYHDKMYVPESMVFTVVGDVNPRAVIDRACQAFAGFARGRVPDLSLPEAQPLAGVQRVTLTNPTVKEATQEMSFLTIPLLHEDLYALDVLAYVLAEGDSSRLVRKIQREQELVTGISCGSYTPDWGKGNFTVSFRSAVGKADAAEKAILDELKAIAEKGVQEDELARAKRQKLADLVYARQTVDSQAAQLGGDYLSTRDLSFSQTYTQRIQAVTAEQVLAAARKYFTFDAMAVTRMMPAGVAATRASTQASAEAKATMFTLPSGLRVVMQPSKQAGLVSMAFVSKGGVLLENEQTSGIGNLMAELSTKGAGDLSADEIAAFFSGAGGNISGNCGYNSFYWQATVLEDNFPKALSIFADVIQRPSLSAKELEILKPVVQSDIEATDENVPSRLMKFFRSKFFTLSPYQMLPIGRLEVVKAATREQLAAWHKNHVKAGDSVLAIYGQFDPVAAQKAVEQLFADLPAGKVDVTLPPAQKLTEKEQLAVLKTDKQQAGVVVAVPSIKVQDLEDRIPLDVLDTIISGWQYPSGWLHDELRGKQLVYVVHAYNMTGLAPGAFVAYALCQPQNANKVVQIIEKDFARTTSYLPTQHEIDLAVNTILTAELLGQQSMESLALSAAQNELYGLGYDFRSRLEPLYRLVKPQDVQRVAKKFFSDGMFVAVTTPQPAVLDQPRTPADAAAPAPAGKGGQTSATSPSVKSNKGDAGGK